MAKKIKYFVISVTGITANGISAIDGMVPGDAVKLLNASYSPLVRNNSTLNDPIGEISLSFNNRGIQPINDWVFPRDNDDNRPEQFMGLLLDCEVIPKSRVNGWYQDKGLSEEYPYSLKVLVKYLADDGR